MKCLFTIPLTAALIASLGGYSWSQSSGAGGGASGSASGGAAGSTATGGQTGAGTAGDIGTAGDVNTAGVPNTPSPTGVNPNSPSGVNPNPVATGAGPANANTGNVGTPGGTGSARPTAGAAGNATVGPNGVNASGQVGVNPNLNDMNSISRTPFFADPGARRQLGLTDAQFNRLSQAYRNALLRYNRGIAGLSTGPNVNPNSQLPNSGANITTDPNLQANQPGVEVQQGLDGNVPTQTVVPQTGPQQAVPRASQQAQARASMTPEQFANQFNTDFNNSVNSTLTDQAMRTRFNQLGLQFRGLSAFNDPTIQRQMNLTGQQRRELAQLAGTFRRDLMALRRNSRTNPTAVQPQFAELQARYNNQLNQILNAQQQQVWTQLTGNQFQFPFSAFFPTNTAVQQNPTTAVPRTGGVQTPQNPTVR